MSLTDPGAAFGRSGLFGKLPSQGDFVVRGLPGDFIAGWDAWLQAGLAESRAQLGGGWEDGFREAPVWRFALAAGVCGPSAWAGILQPSVDRVGRYFPLTVAARIPDDSVPFATMLRCFQWHLAIEKAAEAAFDPSITVDDLAARLAVLDFPREYAQSSEISAEDTLPIKGNDFSALTVPIDGGDSPASIRSALQIRYGALESAGSVWITGGVPAVSPVLLVSKSLPAARQFGALLVGRWQDHDWEIFERGLAAG